MKNCIFCQIIKKEIPAFILKESENFIAFLDAFPHAPGHTLIVPKEHIEKFSQLPEELSQEFLTFSQKIISLLTKTLNTNDFTLGVNEGSLAGQVVPHFHFHIMPRFANDGGGSIHLVVNNKPRESLKEIYQKIKEDQNNQPFSFSK